MRSLFIGVVTTGESDQSISRLRVTRIHLMTGILTTGIVLLLIPFEKTVSPEGHILVIGETGLPASGVVVEQEWADYSVSNSRHFVSSRTDGNGVVRFPRRSSHVPLLWRFISLLLVPIKAAFHMSYGVDSTISACDNDDPHVWTFEENTG